MVGGATLTKLLGTSAWYAPGASVAYLIDGILNDYKNYPVLSILMENIFRGYMYWCSMHYWCQWC